MTRYKVVLVPFPFDDLSSSKVRPAVCLTNPIGLHEHVILAFITSRIPPALLETDLVITTNDTDFAATGLRITSTLQLHRLMTVTKTMLSRELGILPAAMQIQVAARLRKLFDLK